MKLSIDWLLTRRTPVVRAFMLAAAVAGFARPAAAAVDTVNSNALAQIHALMVEKENRTPAQRKMDSQLVYALKQSAGQAVVPGVRPLRLSVQSASDGRVWVDLKATITPDLLSFIQSSNGMVLNNFPQYNAARILVPLSFLEALAERPDVRFVQSAVPAMTQTGSVTSEGDVTHKAAVSRTTYSIGGLGVKVGVLSDSVDYMTQAQGTGDLPPDLVVLPGQSGVPGSGEGTAMLEIVYDLAPLSKLYFATAFNGQASFAQNILNLQSAGCDIIVDDVFYFDESPFQDGIIAQAVNRVTANGGLYFSSAGNSGSKKHGTSGTWQGDFADGGDAGAPVNGKGGRLHSFGTTTYDTATQQGYAVVLFWSDPLGASTNDYDLYVLDSTGSNVVSSSTTVQNGTVDPFEMVPGAANGEQVVVVKASGDARFLHIDTIRGRLAISTDGNIKGHSAATNAFATAAVDVHTSYPNPFNTGCPVESFSSDGPRRVFYQADGSAITPGDFSSTGGAVRQKPDVAAADGVVTTLPSFSGLNPFYGTSAAAPHAGAVTALLKSYNSTLTPDEIRTVLTTSALDNEAPGFDVNAGNGIVMVDRAIAAAPIPLPHPILLISGTAIAGGNGNGIIDMNECNDLYVTLTNAGTLGATNVQITLSTTNRGVFLPQASATYGDIPAGAAKVNFIPFKLSTTPEFVCGTTIILQAVIKSDSGLTALPVQLATGTNVVTRYDVAGPINIPDAYPPGTNSTVLVTNLTGMIRKVTVSLFTTHTWDSDLTFQLIGPDGTAITLSAFHGGSGDNYGLACSPDSMRTTFDDDASRWIGFGQPPFIGAYQPDEFLAAFTGKAGTNANGVWTLRVADNFAMDVGTLQCWSLQITAASCSDGGGQCPGVDLGVRMIDTPNPAVVGSNLVYTITVTNKGPGIARGVVATHYLPSTVNFVSAVPSQGGASESGGVVTCTLGTMTVGATAKIDVTVRPLLAGTIFSSVNVASTDPELDPTDNAASTATVIVPPVADLAVGIAGLPNPTIVGGPLTYTVLVTNNGPAGASGVVISNTLPAGFLVRNVDYSQGTITTAGNVVICNAGLVAKGAVASVTIQGTPQSFGTVYATAQVSGLQPDPYLANNIARVATIVGQASDLALAMFAAPNPVVLGTNLTFTVIVTNLGPNTATNVVLNQTLPTGVSVVTNWVSQGTPVISGSTISVNFGTIVAGGTATLNVVVGTTRIGTLTSSATVTAPQADPDMSNNSASVSAKVGVPFIQIAAAGASLIAESFVPANGTLDPGETVTLNLRLQNAGNVPNTNLVATLLATGGVLSPSGAQNYGILRPIGIPGAGPTARPFTFTVAAGIDTVVATLNLTDGSSNLPPVTFSFPLPKSVAFSNTNRIDIPAFGPATNYPSVLTVAGVTGQVGRVTATLSGLTHTYVHDLNVLLVGPTGVKTVLMSHAADMSEAVGLTFTLDDAAANPLPQVGQIDPGSYKPTAYAPSAVFTNAAITNPAPPYTTFLADFNGLDPNGTWSLYIYDDTDGDSGQVANGWSLSVSTITPVNKLADLGLAASVSPEPSNLGDNLTYTYTVKNAGPSDATGVVFSNTLPAGVTVVSTSVSQGNLSLVGDTLIGSLFTIGVGATANITVVVQPSADVLTNTPAGMAANIAYALLTNSASVSAFETDVHSGDNRVTLVSTIHPQPADLGITLSAVPPVVAVGSNLTYVVTVTNAGPGAAINAKITNALPAAAVFVSSTPSQGSSVLAGGSVITSFGSIPAGGTASCATTVHTTQLGSLTNAVVAASAQVDPDLSNNSVILVTPVVTPSLTIGLAGLTLVSESLNPPNGIVDPGETVTIGFSLQNNGTISSGNLQATLLATGGITSPSAPQNYGTLLPVGLPGSTAVSRTFTFSAAPASGGTIIATLQLTDSGGYSAAINVPFSVPNSAAASPAIAIPDHGFALPYPSSLVVSGLTGYVSKVTVTLQGLTHGFPSDVNALLVGPNGASTMLISHAGAGFSLTTPITLTFSDDAAAALPNNSALAAGTWRPTQYGTTPLFVAPAPAAPYGSALSAFNGTDPNGKWSLFVLDDSAGDSGSIASGWSLNVVTVNPVYPVSDLSVSLSASPATLFERGPITYTIAVANPSASSVDNVVVSQTLPAGLSVISLGSSQGTAAVVGGKAVFQLGTVAAGASLSLTVNATATQVGTLLSSASITGACTDFNQANNTASLSLNVIKQASLTIVSSSGTTFSIDAQPGMSYDIVASSDLLSWTSIGTVSVPPNGSVVFTDPTPGTAGSRFYRARAILP